MEEEQIRPKILFDEFLRLSGNDALNFFGSAERDYFDCPGCGGNKNEFSFEKKGFKYSVCLECDSLFVNPRPTKEAFEKFYIHGKSAKYFADVFLPSVLEIRRQEIFIPRVNQTYEIVKAAGIKPNIIMEIGSGHGTFLEEWGKMHPLSERRAMEDKYLRRLYKSFTLPTHSRTDLFASLK